MATATSLSGKGVHNAYDSVAASATDSVLVAAAAGKKIRVLSFVINQGDTTPSTVTFNSKGAGAGTAISPALKGPANGGFVAPNNPTGWFETIAGEGLTVTTGAGSTSAIVVVYELIPVP
jgi:hypothetical protein